ncbi:APC family permease [Mycolicibacterium goodii]|uniref:APC family permease n=1 Tax=Mycolicibacterium goodii TaxID=134601 RepID=A0ABS6HSB9_MYCGD|nr:APC family permease [Mycolicibacterium goodii]MBU8824197.1 APC family permease [Mycolicibacterium goodii]MBU8838019.1 APC family permease [Mycolicibacterium goodii]
MSESLQTDPRSDTGDTGLRRGVMGGGELAAQAIANIAPSAVIAFTAAAIYTTASGGTWISFALATVVILSVGYCISQFAKRRSSAGSLYSYAATALGPFGAYLTGVSLMIGCFGIAAGSLSGAVAYTATLLNQLGMPVHGLGAQMVLAVLLGALATLFTIRGIRLSARVSLVLELISVSIITLLLVVTMIHLGPRAFDAGQFTFDDLQPSGIAVGMVLAILGFVGFSSADALAREAKDPYRAVPRAIMWSAAGVGVLYVFAAYTQVAALGPALGESAQPLDDIATLVGMPTWFNPILNFGIAASFFAVVVAPMNVIGRILYVMGKEGVVPSAIGRTHPTHLTPHRALLSVGPLVIAVPVVLYLCDVDAMDVVTWVDTYGTYGYMVAYAAAALATVVYLRSINARVPLVWPAATVAIVSMAYVFYANVYPVPPFPLNIIPWLFIATIVVALAWYGTLRRRSPQVISRIGTSDVETLEGVG